MAANGRGINCSVCEIKVCRKYDDAIECLKCNSRFHLKCVNLTIDQYHDMIDKRTVKLWTCCGCENSTITSPSGDAAVANGTGVDAPALQILSTTSGDLAVGTKNCSTESILDLVLHKIDTLAHSIKNTCCCESALTDLKKENKVLKRTIEAQSVIIKSLRDDFAKQIDELKICIGNRADGGGIMCVDATNKSKRTVCSGRQGSSVIVKKSPANKRGPVKDTVASAVSDLQMSPLRESSSIVEDTGGSSSLVSGQPGTSLDICGPEPTVSRMHGEGTGEEAWSTVVRSRGRGKNTVIGRLNAENPKLRVAPRKAYLHVTRLHPQTTNEELKTYLVADFPEVECEPLKSRSPEHYASFKVTVNMDRREKAMDPQIWPQGTYVSRFFHQKKRNLELK